MNNVDLKKISSQVTSRIKTASDAQVFLEYVPMMGTLVIDRASGDEWGKLVIPNEIRQNIFNALCLSDKNFVLPSYEAHVSVFSKDETVSLPKLIDQEGKDFIFFIDDVRTCCPENWDEVDSLFMVKVISPELENLRKHFGFTPKMYGEHDFHITIGIKYISDLCPICGEIWKYKNRGLPIENTCENGHTYHKPIYDVDSSYHPVDIAHYCSKYEWKSGSHPINPDGTLFYYIASD